MILRFFHNRKIVKKTKRQNDKMTNSQNKPPPFLHSTLYINKIRLGTHHHFALSLTSGSPKKDT